jgi:hypothetical protein
MASASYVNIILYLEIAGNFSTCMYIVINTLCIVALYPAPSSVWKPGAAAQIWPKRSPHCLPAPHPDMVADLSKIKIFWDGNNSWWMNRLLDWLEGNPTDWIKLFSDSLQEAKVGNQKKITGKELKLYIYHKIAHAIFFVNENQVIWENYTSYLDKFLWVVENRLQIYVSYLLDNMSIDYNPMPDSRKDTMRSARLWTGLAWGCDEFRMGAPEIWMVCPCCPVVESHTILEGHPSISLPPPVHMYIPHTFVTPLISRDYTQSRQLSHLKANDLPDVDSPKVINFLLLPLLIP